MPTLPTFNFSLRVTPETGREDKIELSLGKWAVHGDTETLDTIREFMAAPPESLRADLSAGDLCGYGWIFNRPQNPNLRRASLKIRTHDLKNDAAESLARAPLFSGLWMFRYNDSGADTSRTIPTELHLSINPLRYVQHNPGPRPLPSANAADWPAPRLQAAEGQPDGRGEFALDGKDNWLPDTAYHAAWANPARWRHHFRSYVCGIGNAFRAELDRVTAEHGGHVTFHEDFRLKKVETAWEFAAVEPIELVRNLAPHLRDFRGLEMETTHYRAPIESRIVNSPSINIRLGANVSLRLYAKTNRRIRFEIIHEDINHRELLGEPQTNSTSQQPRPWMRIFDCLSALRTRAANELNAVLEFLAQRTNLVPSQISGFHLLIAVASAVQSPGLAHTIISLLLGGVINPRNAGAELLAACQSLASAGILAYDGTRRVYDVSTPYAYALAMLRTVPQGRIITKVRQRTRTPQN